LNKKKCEHGYELGPNNEHIFPTYTIKEHDDGKTYTVTEHQQPKQEYDTDKLIAEAHSLIEYNKRQKGEIKQQEPTKIKTKRELELERSTKQWDDYFKQHPSKMRYNIFDELEQAFDY
jgi:hypothetical protein